MRDLSHYGDPPRKPRDETRALRIIARLVVFACAGAAVAAVVAFLLGWT
jgi:hypothetical protein